MNILITAATALEIQPVTEFLEKQHYQVQKKEFNILITGVGGMATTYCLTKSLLQKRADCIIQAGIAGSFNPEISIGSVVMVHEELMGDLGVEENNEFKDVFDLGLMNENDLPFSRKILSNPFTEENKKYGLRSVRSVSMNEITTRKERIELLQNKFGSDIESMEGAAFHYVCLQEKIPFLQLRAISNYVGERNKGNWNLKEAIKNLNDVLITIIKNIVFIQILKSKSENP